MVPAIFSVFAAVGHYFFEKRFLPPKYFFFGLQCDLKIILEIATGKRRF
jgi:hypothetical protein